MEIERELRPLGQENLVGNMVIDFGSNMLILTHPDVKGLRVRRNEENDDVVIDIFAYRISNALRLLVQEEYGGHRIEFHDALDSLIQPSMS